MHRRGWKRLSLDSLTLVGVGIFFLANLRPFIQDDIFVPDEAAVHMAPAQPKRNKIVPTRAVQEQENQKPSKAKHLGFQSAEASPGQRIQTIVILPGPHKTGTTSVQRELSDWFRANHSAFANFSWSIPSEEVWHKHTGLNRVQVEFQFHEEKGHALLAYRLWGNEFLDPHISGNSIIEAYRETLQKDWEAGKNLVIASEELDRITTEGPLLEVHYNWTRKNKGKTLQQILWQRIYDTLPSHPSIHRRIIGGIFHRESRSDHVVSVWHQDGGNQRLSEFTLENGRNPNVRLVVVNGN